MPHNNEYDDGRTEATSNVGQLGSAGPLRRENDFNTGPVGSGREPIVEKTVVTQEPTPQEPTPQEQITVPEATIVAPTTETPTTETPTPTTETPTTTTEAPII